MLGKHGLLEIFAVTGHVYLLMQSHQPKLAIALSRMFSLLSKYSVYLYGNTVFSMNTATERT
jgi:hypothetical protein